jgi:hypothetical protein
MHTPDIITHIQALNVHCYVSLEGMVGICDKVVECQGKSSPRLPQSFYICYSFHSASLLMKLRFGLSAPASSRFTLRSSPISFCTVFPPSTSRLTCPRAEHHQFNAISRPLSFGLFDSIMLAACNEISLLRQQQPTSRVA